MSKSAPKKASLEEELIREIIRGETNLFEELVVKYQDMIYALIRRQIPEEATAKELAQDTFVRAFENLAQFRLESAFSTWITRIALNMTNSYFASKTYKQRAAQVPFDVEMHGGSVGPAETLEGAARDSIVLQRLLGTLKPKYRDVVVLCSLEQKSYEEAAGILEIPVGTVCSRMNMALQLLRRKLALIDQEDAA